MMNIKLIVLVLLTCVAVPQGYVCINYDFVNRCCKQVRPVDG